MNLLNIVTFAGLVTPPVLIWGRGSRKSGWSTAWRYVLAVILFWILLVYGEVLNTAQVRADAASRGEFLLNDTGNTAIVVMFGWALGLFYAGSLGLIRRGYFRLVSVHKAHASTL